MWELDHKESWAPKNWFFELWCWRRLLRVPWTISRSNQSNPKKISPEGLMVKLKPLYFGQLMWRTDSFEKTLILGKIEGGRRRGWWDGWIASPTWWTWVWVNSRSWWWAGNPSMLQSIGLQRVRHAWATELNWIWLSRSFLKSGLSCDLLGSGECKGSGDVATLSLDSMWSWFCSLSCSCALSWDFDLG